MLYKIASLLLIDFIALICATLLYIYVKSKKDELPKWCNYVSLFFIGAAILIKILIVVVAICLACCRHHGGGGGEGRMYMMRHEMRMHERDCERECEGDERCGRGRMDCDKMNCDKECEEECEGKEEMSCPKGKCERDTVVQKVIKK